MNTQVKRNARPMAFIIFALLPGSASFLAAETKALSAEWVKILRNHGICPAQGECAGTPEQWDQLRKLAEETEQWKPVPPKVAPGSGAGAAPADAIILFDGHDLSQWVARDGRSPARWRVHDGVVTVDKSAGNIQTKQHFGSYQLHIEWLIPKDIGGEGQARGNSGLFLASTAAGDAGYEIQILDSWNNTTYVNGQAASLYKQAPPLVNASRPPGEWQSYDVVWTAPTFEADGSLNSPAYVTLFHNGVLVQDHVQLAGETVFLGKPFYRPYKRAPIMLQAHADPSIPISFRNIWLRELARTAVQSR